MTTWKTVASSSTTPKEVKTRTPAQVSSPCSRASITIRAQAVRPAKRDRTTVGVGEQIDLTYSLGSAAWTTTKGTLTSPNGQMVTLQAPDRAGSVTVTATGGGCSSTVTFTVIEPSGVLMQRAPGTNLAHTQGIPSVGVRTEIFLQPDTVSFQFIEISEDDCPGLVTGYFVGTPLDGVRHGTHGAGTWVIVGSPVAGKGSKVIANDTAYTGYCNFGTPYSAGTFDWPIPWKFRLNGGADKVFATVHQRFTINAAGDMTVSKAGANGAAQLNDPTSTY
ncbi:hypothetical protein SAMN05192549_104353 [Duganella sacchari]|uniref:Uncharacterized protein n=1 Tax=Duganella sacchari TaxID=551987 RepID=A0A1M7P2Y0_9BURK|nr:hypothetical protein [Duganella sacchari]SHN10798.1 hypothetical protein SAMN05192549_104353 [Duganella sacchari]